MRKFVNWGRTVVSRPTAWHTPSTDQEIAALVRDAGGQKIRVVGAGHSWSAIAAPDQIALQLDRCTGIVRLDRQKLRVTVRAGMRLRALNAELERAGFALPIVGSIAEQSIAGLIATGTHGSSLVHGNLASFVDAMRIVDGRGTVVDLEGEQLDGARVHLGALGIVTQVRLAIVPAFRLAEEIEAVPISSLPAQLATIAASAEYCKVWWMPHTRAAYVFRYTRTDEPTTTRPSAARRRWVDNYVMHGVVFPAVLQLGRLPGITPRASRMIAQGFLLPRRVGPSALMLSTPNPARHRETECALPMTRAAEAVDRIVHAVDRDQLVVNFPLEIRFVRGDREWMSPASGADTCQIGAYCHGPRSDAYFASFWREMRPLNARPHWGKELDHTVEEVRALWPDFAKFAALRDRLDPERVFGSAFHSRTIGA